MIIDAAPILAIVLPLFAAFLLPVVSILAKRYKKEHACGLFAVAVCVLILLIVASMLPTVWGGKIIVYRLGNWTPPWGINLAIDSLNLLVALIVSSVCTLVAIYSLIYMRKDSGLEKYYILLVLILASTMGIVLTGDVFNLFVFFEIMSIASYALIAFRRKGDSLEASFKYMIIGSLGTSLILLSIVFAYSVAGSVNIADIGMKLASIKAGSTSTPPIVIVMLGLFITGFGIKIAMVPLHAWAPDVYQAAPSSISALLSGATTIAGVYAMIRVVYMMFGAFGVGAMFAVFGLVTMVLGAFMALVQNDLKRLLAYSGISQMGYILLGIGIGTANGIQGGLFHLLNYAIFEAMLFMCAGAIAYRVGTTKLNELGGLGRSMPVTATIFTVGALAISGVPPFNGFASKWMIYVAGVQAGQPIFTVIAVLMSALTLAYFLKVVSTIFLGPRPKDSPKVEEAPMVMLFPMFLLVVFCVLFGILPQLGIDLVQPAQQAIAANQAYIGTVLG